MRCCSTGAVIGTGSRLSLMEETRAYKIFIVIRPSAFSRAKRHARKIFWRPSSWITPGLG
ncbi:MAG TPA: hypothetical protein VGK57_01295 [Candidatus Binatia bacterium]